MSVRTKAARTSIPRHLRDAAKLSLDTPAPRVSAVIPTYNRTTLVPRAIESALRQTFTDLELIVVQDGSPDETVAAVARFDDPRVRVVRLPRNKGQWHAENVGIAYARGEWVAFLDDDDEWLPEKIEKQLARANATAADIIYCRTLRIGKDGPIIPKNTHPLPEGDVSRIVLTPRMPSTPTVFMARREPLLALGGFDESLQGAQDRDLWIRLSLAGHRFAAVPDQAAIYHEDHEDRQMHDPVRMVRSTRVHKRRWRQFRIEAMGAEGFEVWVHRRDKTAHKFHKRHVRAVERSGSRSEALRYVWRMVSVFPWGLKYSMRMLAVVAFGRWPYQLSQVRKGKSGAPWLRKLFGGAG